MRNIGNKDDEQLREHQLKVLAGVLAKTNDGKELESVLNTILTSSEKAAIAQRLSIILKIQKGQSYADIESSFGVSPNTITKSIEMYLKHGVDNDNFLNVLSRYKEPEFKREITSKYKERNPAFAGGIRSLQREQKAFDKSIKKNRTNS